MKQFKVWEDGDEKDFVIILADDQYEAIKKYNNRFVIPKDIKTLNVVYLCELDYYKERCKYLENFIHKLGFKNI